MRNRVLIALALIAGVIVVPAGAAMAQCGPSVPVEEYLDRAGVAFVGSVVDRSNRDRTAVMEVLEVWKGDRLPSRVTVSGGPEDVGQQTSIDRTFLLGQIYLVMPANSRSPFYDSLCSGTQLWTTPTGVIPEHLQEAAGASVPIPVIPGGSGAGVGGGLPGFLGNLGVAALVLALAFGVVFSFKRMGGPRRGVPTSKAGKNGSPQVGGSPAAAFRTRRRRVTRLQIPGAFEDKRGSRLEQVR
jgi:hypothetical protein